MAEPGTIVVVGTGQAGSDTAAALRQAGYCGKVIMVGEEASLPYSRPPLSKAYLKGEANPEDLLLRSEGFYPRAEIEVRTGTKVLAIDPVAHNILLAGGERLRYDRLVLATGGRARRLSRPELASARNVHTLRSVEDAAALRGRLVPGARAVILGAGYIGLEVAAAARHAGAEVTVLEVAPRVLARVTSPVMSEFFHRVHREEGVEITVNAHVDGFTAGACGDITAVRLAGSAPVEADFVLLGIGIAPRTELAEAAGLKVDDGIVVDEFMRTSAEDIFAVGDVARHRDPRHGGLRRLESIPNAVEQARCVAATLTGSPRAYDALPWFWSDQFDLKLHAAGLPVGHSRSLVRGNPHAGRRLTVLYLRGDAVIAADVVNSPADFAAAKRLITAGHPVDPQRLADPDIPLKTFIPKPGGS